MFNIKSLFNKTKECWKYKKCGTDLRNKCPAYTQKKTRECWMIHGTICDDGKAHDEFSRKLMDCTNCDYYILGAWAMDPTEANKKFVKESVHKAREKVARLSIEKILRDCIIRFKSAASVKNIKIEVSLPSELRNNAGNKGSFYGNKDEISHVLLHFISKSLTYSKPKSILYLRADDMGKFLQVGIIYSSMMQGPLLYEDKSSSNVSKEKREILSEEIIAHHAGRCWEEVNPIGRSGLFFTLAKDRRAILRSKAQSPQKTNDNRFAK